MPPAVTDPADHAAHVFADELDRALDARRAELIVIHTGAGSEALREAHEQLAALGVPGTVYDTPTFEVVEEEWRAVDVEQSLAVCRAGCLVVFGELRADPAAWCHRVALAARYVRNGATVVALVDAGTAQAAEERLAALWAQARQQADAPDEEPLPEALPPHRLLAFTP